MNYYRVKIQRLFVPLLVMALWCSSVRFASAESKVSIYVLVKETGRTLPKVFS